MADMSQREQFLWTMLLSAMKTVNTVGPVLMAARQNGGVIPDSEWDAALAKLDAEEAETSALLGKDG